MTAVDFAPAVGVVHGAAELVLPVDAPRPVWLEARRSGIGGSDALACLGLDRWKTRLEVYLDKIDGAPERPQTDRMRWGQVLESALLAWFTERTGLRVERRGLMRSVERPWQLASVDGDAEDGGIVELKNTNYHRRDEWSDEQVADGAEAQSQHYMDVRGAGHAWVVAQIGGEPPVIRRVERDDALIADMRAMELDLWTRVLERTPPPLEGGKASEDLVKRLFPTGVPGKRIEADEDFLQLLREYRKAQQEESAATKRKKAAGVQLKHRMGDATEAYYGARLVATLSDRSKANAAIPVLREQHPQIAAQVVTETRYRQFDCKLKETP